MLVDTDNGSAPPNARNREPPRGERVNPPAKCRATQPARRTLNKRQVAKGPEYAREERCSELEPESGSDSNEDDVSEYGLELREEASAVEAETEAVEDDESEHGLGSEVVEEADGMVDVVVERELKQGFE
ncbi:hypothetical protein LTR91_023129 [Friedmanniomyces endolithicus]|uniref:Uncharacterized protein n=1 Tax=Friedmanniomyces endolithicus TaxID=329885 RepID=A0AAN6H4C3_9PEZI|nr:hypothetical protein LTR38_009642 [Friedmanniomyces endolithicus]KAK0800927.1 hypothetical protein LTR75_008750 [Friedmanniomyces endolithicus]KAK0810980.1 hypothetical protein LTR59_001991 [Friedmanniomyces endolithicus]KAK0841636.1 hypothetical protein LTR03_009777 [Friedmanniomyces endolithicus]KAK0856172.1 hypothetical protein LTS02_010771 [Friedmanniomyces endolithicus]